MIKSDDKEILLQSIYISDKCCSSERSIHQRNLKKLYSAIEYIINIFWAANQNIRMISEGFCDWINDAKMQKNQLGNPMNYIFKYIQNSYFI